MIPFARALQAITANLRSLKASARRRSSAAHGQPKAHSQDRRPVLECLERREVFAADLLSSESFGNNSADTTIDIAIDSSGNRYMAGTFSGRIDLLPSVELPSAQDILDASSTRDAYVAKFDSADNLQWVRQFRLDAAASTVKLAVDSSGNPVIASSFKGTTNLDSITLTTAGSVDVVTAKLSASSGAVIWASSWSSATDDYARDVTLDTSGNVLVATRTSPSGQLFASTSIGILKYNSLGTKQWERAMPLTATATASTNYVNEIATNSAGGIVIAGYLKGTVDFDPSAAVKTVVGNSNTSYTAKYSSAGNLEWVSAFFGSNSSSFSSAATVAFDSAGSIIVGGSYTGSVDFDPSSRTKLLTSGGGYVAKLSATGGLQWASALLQSPSTSISTRASELAIDSTGKIHVGGTFYGTVDFNPGASVVARTSLGGSDIFVLTLNTNGTFAAVDVFGTAAQDSLSEMVFGSGNIMHLATGSLDIDPVTGAFSPMQAGYSRWRRIF